MAGVANAQVTSAVSGEVPSPNRKSIAVPANATPAPVAAPLPTTPYVAIEQPEYPGGDAALIQFLGNTLRYPADAWNADAQGRVVVSFWIDEQGQPYGFGVLQSVYPSLDAEALRALRLMPRWQPGKRGDAPAPMVVHVPVSFRKS